jgi:3-oxoacyl-[acyl-carrier protein] reductase
MDFNLKGRVALITGAGHGIGREIALTLAAEGAAVGINYHRSGADADAVVMEIRSAGGKAKAYRATVGDYAAVETMIAEIAHDFDGLDILVNNAGIARIQKFAKTRPEDWKEQIDVDLYGTIHCCHAALPRFTARGGGRIISLVGDSSRIGESGLAVAAAARGGVIALTKSLAKELGRSGVTANVISLGLVETTHSDAAWLAANREKILRLYPAGRLGVPQDVAPMVALLASDRGSWITGQVLSINGGFCMV